MILSHKTWAIIESTIYKALPSTRHNVKCFTHLFTKPYYKTEDMTCKVGTGRLDGLPTKATQLEVAEMKVECRSADLYSPHFFYWAKLRAPLRGPSCPWGILIIGSLHLSRGTAVQYDLPVIWGVTAPSLLLKRLSASHPFWILTHKISSHFFPADQPMHPSGTLILCILKQAEGAWPSPFYLMLLWDLVSPDVSLYV